MPAFLLACAGIVMTKVSGFVGIYSPMRWSCSLLLSCSLLPFLFPLSSGGGSRYTLHVCTVYSTSFTCVHVHINIHSVLSHAIYPPLYYTYIHVNSLYVNSVCVCVCVWCTMCMNSTLQLVSHSVSTLHYSWSGLLPKEGITITPTSGSIGVCVFVCWVMCFVCVFDMCIYLRILCVCSGWWGCLL